MSLNEKDQIKITELFEKKAQHQVDSEEYRKYRDQIFTDVLYKLEDYFSVLKWEWRSKFNISEEDSISIIHDGLLAAVNTFEGDQKRATFLTYLVHVLKNKVKNFITLNYIGARRSKRKVRKAPLNFFISLDHLAEAFRKVDDDNGVAIPLSGHLYNQYLNMETREDQRYVIESFLNRLQPVDKKVVQHVLDGYTLKDIANSLNMTLPGVKYRINKIAQKFKKVGDELCR